MLPGWGKKSGWYLKRDWNVRPDQDLLECDLGSPDRFPVLYELDKGTGRGSSYWRKEDARRWTEEWSRGRKPQYETGRTYNLRGSLKSGRSQKREESRVTSAPVKSFERPEMSVPRCKEDEGTQNMKPTVLKGDNWPSSGKTGILKVLQESRLISGSRSRRPRSGRSQSDSDLKGHRRGDVG